VISVEAWTTIRYLHAQGLGIRQIARELGLARNTVRAALRVDTPPKYTRPKRPNPQLAPFAEQIAAMLFEQRFIGSRILRELRRLGYRVGPTAQVANTLGRQLQLLRGQELLVIDELGYTPMDPQRATLFFQLVSQKYAHSSIIVTTNVPFDQWGRIFGNDDVIAAAILDRLLHYSEVFAISGPSYRLRGKLAQ
jgi:hypothetical protein